jgi:hypothetical protein
MSVANGGNCSLARVSGYLTSSLTAWLAPSIARGPQAFQWDPAYMGVPAPLIHVNTGMDGSAFMHVTITIAVETKTAYFET